MPAKRLALKVDCDTFEGTKKGIPTLLKLFREFGIKASFFFTLGPDTSGRALKRIFTQKGFLKKMFRSNAAALYGPKTMLYGTLLPSPMIGDQCADVIKSVEADGHEVGVHGWDHIRWHDKLGAMQVDAIRHDYARAHETFKKIFGHSARSSAAPGWHATDNSRRVIDEFNLLYTSDTRNASPFFPLVDGRPSKTLEIPSTLPTWDEMWGDPQFRSDDEFIGYYAGLIRGTEVHSIHTELEAGVRSPLFRRQLELWDNNGVEFVTLKQLAEEALATPSKIPVRRLTRISIPNRGGLVSSAA